MCQEDLTGTEKELRIESMVQPIGLPRFDSMAGNRAPSNRHGSACPLSHSRIDVVLNGGYDNSKLENDSYENAALDRTNGFAYGNWSEYNSRNYNVGGNATLRLIENDSTNLSVMVGAEAQKFESDGFGYNLRDSEGPAYASQALRDSLFGLQDSLYDAVSTVTNAYPIQYRTDGFASTFARMNYNVNDRYFFQATARVDGSSRFGENNRFGFFPSASVGWVASDEDWFNSETISFLKVRTSWAKQATPILTVSADLRCTSSCQGATLRGRYDCVQRKSRQPRPAMGNRAHH